VDSPQSREWLMQKKRAVSQFFGYITPRQAAAGIEAALTNAQSLCADAQLLLKRERWSRAAALSILAIEEAGKVSIIREIPLARNSDDLKLAWRSYRTHSKKSNSPMASPGCKRGKTP